MVFNIRGLASVAELLFSESFMWVQSTGAKCTATEHAGSKVLSCVKKATSLHAAIGEDASVRRRPNILLLFPDQRLGDCS